MMGSNGSQAWGQIKVLGSPPSHCPFCGEHIEVVRGIMAGWFELACERCERTAVISIDDHQSLPKGTR